MDAIQITMLIIWAIVIAASLMVEFIVPCFVSVWFSAGGIAALITLAARGPWWLQLLLFFVVSLAFLLALRPLVKKFVKTRTTPTNLDANIGKIVKLLKDVKDDRSEIKLDDILWTVACKDDLSAGTLVTITGMEGNKYIVQKEDKK